MLNRKLSCLLLVLWFVPAVAFATPGDAGPGTPGDLPIIDALADETEAPGDDDSAAVPAPAEPEVEAEANTEPVTPAETLEDAQGLADAMFKAAEGGHWTLFAGLLILILVFIADRVLRLKEKVGPKALPWVAMGLSVLAVIGVGLASDFSVMQIVTQSISVAATAGGLWELVFKHFLKREIEAPKPS